MMSLHSKVMALTLVAATSGQAMTISPTRSSQTHLSLPVGESISITLDDNPSTGYAWSFTMSESLQITSDTYIPNSATEKLVGAGGTRITTIKVVKAGAANFTGYYYRPWQARPAPTFTLAIQQPSKPDCVSKFP